MIKERDVIRTTVPLEGPDVLDATRMHQLPVGSPGAVVYIFGEGEAFEVEFLVGPEDAFRSVQIPVDAGQCELAWVAPA